MSRYLLRLSARNLRGVVALDVATLGSARALARAWVSGLQNAREIWSVELIDNEGHREEIT